jgi:hypothetical protein
MGTSSLKSTVITNRDASPRVASNANLAGGILRSAVGSATAAAADDTNSRYRVIRIPTNAYVRAVYVSSVAQGGSGAVNVGVYRATADGGAVVSATLFASALSVVSAVSRSDVTNQSTNYTAAKREQPLWQAAGLTSDPGGELDLVIAPSAALTNGGAIAAEVQYVV